MSNLLIGCLLVVIGLAKCQSLVKDQAELVSRCGTNGYQCLQTPPGCTSSPNSGTTPSCIAGLAWRTTANKQNVEVSLWTTSQTQPRRWVSLGLSRDRKMGKDSVLTCMQLENNQLGVRLQWNEDDGAPDTLSTQLLNEYVSETQGGSIGNYMQCSFLYTINATVNDAKVYKMYDTYYQLLAWGDMKAGEKTNKHTLKEDTLDYPINSPAKVKMADVAMGSTKFTQSIALICLALLVGIFR